MVTGVVSQVQRVVNSVNNHTYEGTDGHSLHMHVCVHVWVHGCSCGGVGGGRWGAWLCQVGWDQTEKSLWAKRSLENFRASKQVRVGWNEIIRQVFPRLLVDTVGEVLEGR